MTYTAPCPSPHASSPWSYLPDQHVPNIPGQIPAAAATLTSKDLPTSAILMEGKDLPIQVPIHDLSFQAYISALVMCAHEMGYWRKYSTVGPLVCPAKGSSTCCICEQLPHSSSSGLVGITTPGRGSESPKAVH